MNSGPTGGLAVYFPYSTLLEYLVSLTENEVACAHAQQLTSVFTRSVQLD